MSKLTYIDKPVFGLDIGRSSIKVMQIDNTGKKAQVVAYGNTNFDPDAIAMGVIVDIEAIVKSTHELCTQNLIGALTTKRVSLSLPNEHSFSRILSLPIMNESDLALAVFNEAERAIPLPINELYFDYRAMGVSDDGSQEVQLVATPKKIVDSYMQVAAALGIEVAAVETNITAVSRMVTHSEGDDVVSLIIDLGSTAADLSIYDGNSVRITGTADCGSDDITALIGKALGVSVAQAHTIKTRYGLEPSKKQKEIRDAIEPELSKLVAEIRKVMRYYSERASVEAQIGQVIVLGGGANLPGLSTYLTNEVRLPTRLCDPWQNLTFGALQPPSLLETTLYTTAGGLSLVRPEDLSA